MAIKFNNKSSSVKVRKSASDKIFKFLFILTILSTVIMGFYVLAPLAGAMAGFVVYLTGIVIALVPGVCTLFMIYASEGFRNFLGNWFNIGTKLFDGTAKLQEQIASPYYIIMSICLTITIATLIMSIVLYKKKGEADIHNEHKHKMVASIVLTVLLVIFTIISALLIFVVKK